MRFLLFIVLLPLVAQTPPVTSAPTTTPAPAAAPATPAAPSPVPLPEPDLAGWVDVGYRWTSGVNGSQETYRSVVNLGAGPKLFGADFTLIDPNKRLFETMHVRASGWGGDPYGSFHLDAMKTKLYQFNADYRDLSYFNNLPTYADPLLTRGIILDEQSFDTRRHIGSYSLELLPGNWFIPYVAYDRDANSGTGTMAFVQNSNEYAVPTSLNDLTNLYRGGIRFELRRFHATIEEGGTTFSSNQSLYQSLNQGPGATNPGNSNVPVFGQTLDLASLAATYGISGTSAYTKALFSSNAFSWMDVYGQFLFSQPDSSVHYQESATGNLYLPSQILFYQSEQYLVSAAAKLPHTTVNLGAEIRPLKRIRLTESWLTDRVHNAGNSQSQQTIGVQQTAELLAASLVSNYNQTETNLFFDVTSKLTLRGGYRYVWGDASDAVLPQGSELTGVEQAKLRRNVGLAGIVYRPTHKLLLTAETEVASSGGVYFNTSLYDYQKLRAQARYQATGSLSVALDFTYLNNDNPTPGINYRFRSQQEAASLFWSPRSGKLFTVQGSYSWSSLRSDIFYLVAQTLTPLTSDYVENAHMATALMNFNLGKWGIVAPKLTAGGSLFISSGTRPTSYYQPMAKLWVPVSKHAQAFAEWWFYGYSEAMAAYEGFGTHLAAVGVRYTR